MPDVDSICFSSERPTLINADHMTSPECSQLAELTPCMQYNGGMFSTVGITLNKVRHHLEYSARSSWVQWG